MVPVRYGILDPDCATNEIGKACRKMLKVQKVLSAVGAAMHVVADGSIPEMESEYAKVAFNVATVKRRNKRRNSMPSVTPRSSACSKF